MNNLIKVLLLSSLFLLPLIGPIHNLGYEQAKVLFFILSISLIGFMWLGRGFKWSLISKLSGIFILVLLITSLSGIDIKTSLLGADPYFQGWVLYAYLWLFSLMVVWSKIKLETWAYVLVGSATLVGILAIKDWLLVNLLGQQIPTYAGRVVSTFGQPNFYSGFILLTLPFFNFLLASKGSTLRSWGIMMGFLISIVAIILSQSRTAYLLLSVLMIWWLVSGLMGRKILIFTGILIIAILAIFSSVFLTTGLFWKEIVKPNLTTNPDLTEASVENRVYIWPVSYQTFVQKPFTGYGLENIDRAFENYFTTNKHALFEENLNINPVLISLKELNIDRSHNYILDLLLFSGVFGLISWIFLVGILIKKLLQSEIKPETTALLLGLITYLIWVQFQNQSVVHLIYFWLLVGLIDKN